MNEQEYWKQRQIIDEINNQDFMDVRIKLLIEMAEKEEARLETIHQLSLNRAALEEEVCRQEHKAYMDNQELYRKSITEASETDRSS